MNDFAGSGLSAPLLCSMVISGSRVWKQALGGEHVIARSQDLSNAQRNVWLVDVELSILENHHPPQILEGTA